MNTEWLDLQLICKGIEQWKAIFLFIRLQTTPGWGGGGREALIIILDLLKKKKKNHFVEVRQKLHF